MAITNTTDRPLISIFFCGGTGYNIGAKFAPLVEANPVLRETVKFHFLDTSTANDHAINTEENTHVFGSGKGSGKIRGANAEEIMEGMPGTLQKFKPGTFVIAVGGASGGSGSTIMNCLQAELAERNQGMVNVLIGSRASASEIKNTHKTFQSLAQTAQAYSRPSVVYYRENTTEKPRNVIDENVLNDLTLMALLFSGKDDKMDISDLENLLNYPVATDFPAALVGFDLFLNEIKQDKHEVLIGAASIGSPGSNLIIEPAPAYHTGGYLPENITECFKDNNVMHWAILGNSYTPLMKSLATRVKEFEEATKAVRLDTFVTEPVTKGRTLVI